MTRGRLIALLVVGSSLLAPGFARAQNSGGFTLYGATPFSLRTIPVRFSGQLTVDFHGDAASGCASSGLCGYSGMVSWRPPPTGSLEIFASREHGRLSYTLDLEPGGGASYPGLPGGVATANVQLSSPPLSAPTSSCLDATATGNSFTLPVRHGRVTFTLAGASPSLLATRCAGPLDSDLLREIAAPTLPLGTVLRGRRAVALTAAGTFASHGFAGTVESTVTMALGSPGRNELSGSQNQSSPIRQIQVLYRASLSGSVLERIAGAANPDICAPLGSCGLSGMVTLAPRATGVAASISAVGVARTPLRDLLTAVGVSTGGPTKGIVTIGTVTWDGGTTIAKLAQASTTCSDSAPLGGGDILLTSGKGRLEAQFEPYGFDTATGRTRCPGPGDTNAPALATAIVPASRLTHRTIRLSLTTGSSFSDSGYTVQTIPHLTLTLTRIGVRTEPEATTVINGSVETVSSSAGTLSGSAGSVSASLFGP
jgi:hypothetical protein